MNIFVFHIRQNGAGSDTYSQISHVAEQHKIFAENNYLPQSIESKSLILNGIIFALRMSSLLKPA